MKFLTFYPDYFMFRCLCLAAFISLTHLPPACASDATQQAADIPENLSEMINRKDRLSIKSFPVDQLENSKDHYTWQPESLCYTDVLTGHEVWRMTSTPGLFNIYHNMMSAMPWSADGKRLAFISDRKTTAYHKEEGQRSWFLVNTDGRHLRPVIEGPAREYSHTPSFTWSPQMPDVYYEFARNRLGIKGLKQTDLYKSIVTDKEITKTLLLSFPDTQFSELVIGGISADGRKVIVTPWGGRWIYPATIYPEHLARLDVQNGYATYRNLDTRWGDTPAKYDHPHGMGLLADGAWLMLMPSGSHAHWRIKVLGSAPDGGSGYSYTPPATFGEQWPENTLNHWGGERDPFGCNYWSHGLLDPWGRHVLFSNTDAKPLGPGIWDMQRHRYVVSTFGGGAQHHSWSGYTDWNVSTRGPGFDKDYLNDRIYIQKYNDTSSQKPVAATHTFYNFKGIYQGANVEYFALPRPAQSPDGTKVAFHGTFLSKGSNPDIYWAVAYYPLPPTGLAAGETADGIKIMWLPPRYTQRNWPYASPKPVKDKLDWPLLDDNGNEIGEPLYAREIKRYHIWQSPDGKTGWRDIGSVDAQYSSTYAEEPDWLMLHPIASGRRVSATNKISFNDAPADGVWYYAVTSEEHSGLESDKLSEVLEVNVKEGRLKGNRIIQAEGPKNFWRISPSAPNPNIINIAAGKSYRLNWVEPDDSKIRYYNIYYSPEKTPPPTQPYRIASVPVGTVTFLDWLADNSKPGYYRLTSVDRYGNEGLSVNKTTTKEAIKEP